MSTLTLQGTPEVINDAQVEKWSAFIEKKNAEEKIPEPYKAIDTLINKYSLDNSEKSILDIGCETGKNAIPLIKSGHKITLLDIAPNAVRYTQENLQKLGLENGIADSIVGKIESLDPKYGPFKAVIGTYAFSFIPPELFKDVMKNNVLGRVADGGYFAGGFFGEKHSWADNPELTMLTLEAINTLFEVNSFSILETEESLEEIQTKLDGVQLFHVISVIAQRIL